MGSLNAFAGDAGSLISVSILAGTQVMPRTIFTQTWTFTNSGTTTWTATQNGYTLNMIATDTLGALPLFTNMNPTRYLPTAIIGSGKSVPPGGQATYSMSFIAPEAAGSYTDTFQLNSASSVYFGAPVTVQVTVKQAGSTNQYDRSMAVSYANNYAAYVVSDGYFWTNGSGFGSYGAGTLLPASLLISGDDCAHFVSCCIGKEPHERGGGLNVISRGGTYGEPGAQRLIYTNLIGGGYAEEVSSVSQMEPGDVIGWNWEGDTDPADIDHVTLYLGKGLIAAHANSHLDVSFPYYLSGSPTPVYHLIHILDAPTMVASRTGKNLVLSWGTNWTGYAMYTATSLAPGATWTKMTKAPVVKNGMNMMTNAMSSSGATYYRLVLPGS